MPPLADAMQSEAPGQKSTARPEAVRVEAAARLHLGFLDLNGSLGRLFGSIGLAINRPRTELVLRRSDVFRGDGPDHERAVRQLQRFAKLFDLTSSYEISIKNAIPPHAGLGSGTQLAVAAGVALAALEGIDITPTRLGEVVDRGARSAIGIASFERGGFIVDGGKGGSDRAPPIMIRTDFPEAWRALLVTDPKASGVHGEAETNAFATLPPLPDAAAASVCRLVLMQLVPALMEEEIEPFGDALTEIQKIVGGHFAAAQGGSPWTSPAVGRVVEALRANGAIGIGQSSWGPTGFAFAASQEIAQRLYDSSIELARGVGLEIMIVEGRNRGATIEKITNT
ncbi:beta-ribofuranosylaminobenzene 5'-phosphate synthase [Hyphomicrobium sulfonivorans]|uniref:Beta-ribofuranosylaminobenzene 5'-phosphate synthase n=1 Tax=Hyphomicrobium sulfonivorans TaxID=121290 RepID=A0A120CWK5_HYPSL|nr:beta-ribofuranosylaminobenzene 5'-phosphate synthase family protein [Hyphomicrobium sulfonivorans]KWT69494.1 beta-ribofuranosylaminobenzene 5'-phosphate synthase [Hyphomicrobium sulfonivorans]